MLTIGRQVRDDLNFEALQFVKEQRIRCLLEGAWFPLPVKDAVTKNAKSISPPQWRYVRLSRNRRFLQWADFESKRDPTPTLDELKETSECVPCVHAASNDCTS
jgi:engulfment and cell motility protein 1